VTFLPSKGGGKKNLFLIIHSKHIRTSERGRGITFQFLPWGKYGGSMDVLWMSTQFIDTLTKIGDANPLMMKCCNGLQCQPFIL
jgi:hypothetical protein